ncbi:MAG: hypothetical protein JXC85_05650 [Candidatus Aenigmarchaeota archaeon]|nr:hypothetical protein [Candidatus Aenigmarchaeota archaeon]
MESHVSHRFRLNGHTAIVKIYFDVADNGTRTWPQYDVKVDGELVGERRLVPVPWNDEMLIRTAKQEYRHIFHSGDNESVA